MKWRKDNENIRDVQGIPYDSYFLASKKWSKEFTNRFGHLSKEVHFDEVEGKVKPMKWEVAKANLKKSKEVMMVENDKSSKSIKEKASDQVEK